MADEQYGTPPLHHSAHQVPRISWKVLTQQLRELQRDALIKRQMFAEMRARRILVDAVWKEAASGSLGARFLGQKAHTATEGRHTVLYDLFNCQKPLTFLCPPCGRETLAPWSIYWNCQNKQERDVKKFGGRCDAGRRGARYGCATENSSVQY